MRSFTRVLSVILLVAWMGFIFYMSAQPAEVSSQISGGVIELVAERFYPDFDALTEIQRAQVIESFQFVVRKSAHIAGFALLGFFAFLTFISYTRLRFFTRLFWASAVSVLFAASDEWHQRFVPGRSCELRDFLLDTAGVLGAIIICALFVKIIPPLRRKTAFAGRTKKEVVLLNNLLYRKLDDVTHDKKQLENRVAKQEKTIEELEISLSEKTIEALQIQAECEEIKVEQKREVKLSPEMQYAAKIIGESVVEVTKVCNNLTAGGSAQNTKELVNLALGRNEVLKAEILKILGAEISFEEKKALMEKEKQEAYDYFNSIMAQMR